MKIEDAQQRILDALNGMDVETLDSDKSPKIEGLWLSFEGYAGRGYDPEEYVFGLYVSKKILNKQTQTIYQQLDAIASKVLEHAAALDREDSIQIKSAKPVSFDNGILEYRLGITVK